MPAHELFHSSQGFFDFLIRCGIRATDESLAAHAKGYAQLLRGHIDKEDTILYPLAERVLPQEVRAAMLAAYAQAEAATPELAAKYRELVGRYEHQAAA